MDALQIQRELEAAANLFSPARDAPGSRPLQVLWEVFAKTAFSAGVATAMSGGTAQVLKTAGVAATVAALTKAIGNRREFGRVLFGRGAFDLARKIRTEAAKAQVAVPLLSRLLTASERAKLGL